MGIGNSQIKTQNRLTQLEKQTYEKSPQTGSYRPTVSLCAIAKSKNRASGRMTIGVMPTKGSPHQIAGTPTKPDRGYRHRALNRTKKDNRAGGQQIAATLAGLDRMSPAAH